MPIWTRAFAASLADRRKSCAKLSVASYLLDFVNQFTTIETFKAKALTHPQILLNKRQNMERGITSYSAYIPRLRIERAAIAAAHSWAFPSQRGKGARALANWDEDTITMGVEAARGAKLDGISAIAFASTTPPYADLQNATLVAAAIGLTNNVASSDASGSLRAGTSALLNALESNRTGDALIVASDARRAKPGSAQELAYGAGAVAMTVGTENVIARLIGHASRSIPFVDHYRTTGEPYDYFWEERWIRDEGYGKILPPAIKAALAETNLQPSDIKYFCLPATMKGIAAAVAKKSGIAAEAVEDDLSENCGDTGAAHGLMMLAATLEKAKPGERIMVMTFGAGCDVLVFEATDAIASYASSSPVSGQVAHGVAEPHYTKLLSFHGELNLDWGMRGEFNEKIAQTQAYRASDQLATFTAGKCPDCGAVQFPQLAKCVNCGSLAELSPHSLVNEGAAIASFTGDWLQFTPSPPLYFGLVNFNNGARVMMEFADVDPALLGVGTPLRMVYRIKSIDNDRHNSRYFWKAVPMAPAGE
jgi:3-hydroxy-3-methylglutaryl CoA synthase/uncharacterized OB-fold protein